MKDLNVSCLAKVVSIAALLTVAGCSTSSVGIPDMHQAEMNAYCSALAQEKEGSNTAFKTVETFFSWKLHTCVQAEIGREKDWFTYDLNDISHGFLRGPGIAKTEIPLMVQLNNEYGIASVEGYWESTDSGKDRQLVSSIVANIQCDRDEKVCRERDGTLFMGMLGSDQHEYHISSWSPRAIIADGDDDAKCGIGHRLIIDSESKSVVVNDYPKKLTNDPDCKAFQNANSYALKGGSLMMFNAETIFTCSTDGVSSASIVKVNGFKGMVSDKHSADWTDDGNGGPSSIEKKAAKPFTQADCDRAMQKKIAELKAD